jgi:hypothetical protein
MSDRTGEYFVPGDDINLEVITADIARYLGNDALVRPGIYEVSVPSFAVIETMPTVLQDPWTRQIQQGYFITAYRNLTTVRGQDEALLSLVSV